MKDYPSPYFIWLACSAAFGDFAMALPVDGTIDAIGAIGFSVVGIYCAVRSVMQVFRK